MVRDGTVWEDPYHCNERFVQTLEFRDMNVFIGDWNDPNSDLWGAILLVENDTISGDLFADLIKGGLGADALFGRNGNDRLVGERGSDDLRGWQGQ